MAWRARRAAPRRRLRRCPPRPRRRPAGAGAAAAAGLACAARPTRAEEHSVTPAAQATPDMPPMPHRAIEAAATAPAAPEAVVPSISAGHHARLGSQPQHALGRHDCATHAEWPRTGPAVRQSARRKLRCRAVSGRCQRSPSAHHAATVRCPPSGTTCQTPASEISPASSASYNAPRADRVNPSVAAPHRTAQPLSAPPQRIHALPAAPTATPRQPDPPQARHPHADAPFHPPEHPPGCFAPPQRTHRQRHCCHAPPHTAQRPPPHAPLPAASLHPPPCHRARSCCARCAPTIPAESRAQPQLHSGARPTSAPPREPLQRTHCTQTWQRCASCLRRHAQLAHARTAARPHTHS